MREYIYLVQVYEEPDPDFPDAAHEPVPIAAFSMREIAERYAYLRKESHPREDIYVERIEYEPEFYDPVMEEVI